MRGFLKAVVTFSLMMGAVLTLGVLAVSWRACEITGSAVASLAALWSSELALGALLKVKKENKDGNFKI